MTLLLLCYLCDFISFLSLAETHAGDDRSDAGPDENEIRRVRVMQATRDPYPTRSPHTPRSLHMHSLILPNFIHPYVQEGIITPLFLLQKTYPSISCWELITDVFILCVFKTFLKIHL